MNLHPLALKSVDQLKEMKQGDTITSDRFAAILKIDCGKNSEGKKRIRAAVKHCRSNQDIRKVFEWDRAGETLTCLEDEDIIRVPMERGRKSTYRLAKRIQQLSICVMDEKRLKTETRTLYEAVQLQALMTERIASTKATKHLGNGSGNRYTIPDTAKLIDMMKE